MEYRGGSYRPAKRVTEWGRARSPFPDEHSPGHMDFDTLAAAGAESFAFPGDGGQHHHQHGMGHGPGHPAHGGHRVDVPPPGLANIQRVMRDDFRPALGGPMQPGGPQQHGAGFGPGSLVFSDQLSMPPPTAGSVFAIGPRRPTSFGLQGNVDLPRAPRSAAAVIDGGGGAGGSGTAYRPSHPVQGVFPIAPPFHDLLHRPMRSLLDTLRPHLQPDHAPMGHTPPGSQEQQHNTRSYPGHPGHSELADARHHNTTGHSYGQPANNPGTSSRSSPARHDRVPPRQPAAAVDSFRSGGSSSSHRSRGAPLSRRDYDKPSNVADRGPSVKPVCDNDDDYENLLNRHALLQQSRSRGALPRHRDYDNPGNAADRDPSTKPGCDSDDDYEELLTRHTLLQQTIRTIEQKEKAAGTNKQVSQAKSPHSRAVDVLRESDRLLSEDIPLPQPPPLTSVPSSDGSSTESVLRVGGIKQEGGGSRQTSASSSSHLRSKPTLSPRRAHIPDATAAGVGRASSVSPAKSPVSTHADDPASSQLPDSSNTLQAAAGGELPDDPSATQGQLTSACSIEDFVSDTDSFRSPQASTPPKQAGDGNGEGNETRFKPFRITTGRKQNPIVIVDDDDDATALIPDSFDSVERFESTSPVSRGTSPVCTQNVSLPELPATSGLASFMDDGGLSSMSSPAFSPSSSMEVVRDQPPAADVGQDGMAKNAPGEDTAQDIRQYDVPVQPDYRQYSTADLSATIRLQKKRRKRVRRRERLLLAKHSARNAESDLSMQDRNLPAGFPPHGLPDSDDIELQVVNTSLQFQPPSLSGSSTGAGELASAGPTAAAAPDSAGSGLLPYYSTQQPVWLQSTHVEAVVTAGSGAGIGETSEDEDRKLTAMRERLLNSMIKKSGISQPSPPPAVDEAASPAPSQSLKWLTPDPVVILLGRDTSDSDDYDSCDSKPADPMDTAAPLAAYRVHSGTLSAATAASSSAALSLSQPPTARQSAGLGSIDALLRSVRSDVEDKEKKTAPAGGSQDIAISRKLQILKAKLARMEKEKREHKALQLKKKALSSRLQKGHESGLLLPGLATPSLVSSRDGSATPTSAECSPNARDIDATVEVPGCDRESVSPIPMETPVIDEPALPSSSNAASARTALSDATSVANTEVSMSEQPAADSHPDSASHAEQEVAALDKVMPAPADDPAIQCYHAEIKKKKMALSRLLITLMNKEDEQTQQAKCIQELETALATARKAHGKLATTVADLRTRVDSVKTAIIDQESLLNQVVSGGVVRTHAEATSQQSTASSQRERSPPPTPSSQQDQSSATAAVSSGVTFRVTPLATREQSHGVASAREQAEISSPPVAGSLSPKLGDVSNSAPGSPQPVISKTTALSGGHSSGRLATAAATSASVSDTTSSATAVSRAKLPPAPLSGSSTCTDSGSRLPTSDTNGIAPVRDAARCGSGGSSGSGGNGVSAHGAASQPVVVAAAYSTPRPVAVSVASSWSTSSMPMVSSAATSVKGSTGGFQHTVIKTSSVAVPTGRSSARSTNLNSTRSGKASSNEAKVTVKPLPDSPSFAKAESVSSKLGATKLCPATAAAKAAAGASSSPPQSRSTRSRTSTRDARSASAPSTVPGSRGMVTASRVGTGSSEARPARSSAASPKPTGTHAAGKLATGHSASAAAATRPAAPTTASSDAAQASSSATPSAAAKGSGHADTSAPGSATGHPSTRFPSRNPSSDSGLSADGSRNTARPSSPRRPSNGSQPTSRSSPRPSDADGSLDNSASGELTYTPPLSPRRGPNLASPSSTPHLRVSFDASGRSTRSSTSALGAASESGSSVKSPSPLQVTVKSGVQSRDGRAGGRSRSVLVNEGRVVPRDRSRSPIDYSRHKNANSGTQDEARETHTRSSNSSRGTSNERPMSNSDDGSLSIRVSEHSRRVTSDEKHQRGSSSSSVFASEKRTVGEEDESPTGSGSRKRAREVSEPRQDVAKRSRPDEGGHHQRAEDMDPSATSNNAGADRESSSQQQQLPRSQSYRRRVSYRPDLDTSEETSALASPSQPHPKPKPKTLTPEDADGQSSHSSRTSTQLEQASHRERQEQPRREQESRSLLARSQEQEREPKRTQPPRQESQPRKDLQSKHQPQSKQEQQAKHQPQSKQEQQSKHQPQSKQEQQSKHQQKSKQEQLLKHQQHSKQEQPPSKRKPPQEQQAKQPAKQQQQQQRPRKNAPENAEQQQLKGQAQAPQRQGAQKKPETPRVQQQQSFQGSDGKGLSHAPQPGEGGDAPSDTVASTSVSSPSKTIDRLRGDQLEKERTLSEVCAPSNGHSSAWCSRMLPQSSRRPVIPVRPGLDMSENRAAADSIDVHGGTAEDGEAMSACPARVSGRGSGFQSYKSPLTTFRAYQWTTDFKRQYPATSATFRNSIAPQLKLCPFDLHGTCNDSACPWQHLSKAVGTAGNEESARVSDLADTADLLLQSSRTSTLLPGSQAPPSPSVHDDEATLPAAVAWPSGSGESSGSAVTDGSGRSELQAALTASSTRQAASGGDTLRYFTVDNAGGGEDIRKLEEHLESCPDDVPSWLELERMKMRRNLAGSVSVKSALDTSLHILSKALECNKHREEVWVSYLQCYARQERKDLDVVLQQACLICPAHSVLQQYMLLSRTHSGKVKASRAAMPLLHARADRGLESADKGVLSHQVLETMLYQAQVDLLSGRQQSACRHLADCIRPEMVNGVLELPCNRPGCLLTPPDLCVALVTLLHMEFTGEMPPDLYSPVELQPSLIVCKDPFVVPWDSVRPTKEQVGDVKSLTESFFQLWSAHDSFTASDWHAVFTAYRNLAALFVQVGLFSEALGVVTRFVRSCGKADTSPAWLLHGEVLRVRGDPPGKINKFYSTVLPKFPSITVSYQLALLFTDKTPGHIFLVLETAVRSCCYKQDYKAKVDSVTKRLHLLHFALGLWTPHDLGLEREFLKPLTNHDKAYLWLAACLWHDKLGMCAKYDDYLHEFEGHYEFNVDATFRAALTDVHGTEGEKIIWEEYLLYYHRRLSAPDVSTSAFEAFEVLVLRCMSAVSPRRAIAWQTDQATWLDYRFHNMVIDLYLSTKPHSQQLAVFDRLTTTFPHNAGLAMRAVGHALSQEPLCTVEARHYLATVLQWHPACVHLWKMAIRLEQYLGQIKQARWMFQEATKSLPLCASLWKEYLLFELAHNPLNKPWMAVQAKAAQHGIHVKVKPEVRSEATRGTLAAAVATAVSSV